MIKNLTARVVEHTQYDDKVLHIEKISYDLANMLADMMNQHFDSFFTVEDENDE